MTKCEGKNSGHCCCKHFPSCPYIPPNCLPIKWDWTHLHSSMNIHLSSCCRVPFHSLKHVGLRWGDSGKYLSETRLLPYLGCQGPLQQAKQGSIRGVAWPGPIRRSWKRFWPGGSSDPGSEVIPGHKDWIVRGMGPWGPVGWTSGYLVNNHQCPHQRPTGGRCDSPIALVWEHNVCWRIFGNTTLR